MCGIAGFSGTTGSRVSPEALAAYIRHRGPDDSGWMLLDDERVGLALQRLSIIDLSPAGHQPMSSPDAMAHIIFNGEIYNYRELRVELEAAGYRFRSESDTEVLLNLYLRDGDAMLHRLNGIFAFAIFDVRTGELFLARDPLGVKPLYYAAGNDVFSFASEMKVLLRTGLVTPSLNPAAVLRHLGLLWSPGAETLVSGIRKLEPGHAMVVRRGSVARAWCYYDLPFGSTPLSIPVEEIATQVAAAIRTAVTRQMVADVPVGAFLSGGLDSSAVVAFAREQMRDRRMQCFTIDVREGSHASEGFTDDLPYAQQVARHLDVDLHVVTVGPEMVDRLPEMIYYLDEPTADPAALNTLFISELARSHGIKVLLSGAGGDDIFSGYRRHFTLQQERYWGWLPMAARAGLADFAMRLPTASPLMRRFRKAFENAALPRDTRLANYFAWLRPAMATQLLHPDFARGLSESTLLAPLLDSLQRLPASVAHLDKMLYLECKHFLADHNLNYTDKMGMAAGVEVRVPLLDLDLVALAARLPAKFKQRGATGKWIFKQAMEPFLPRNVIYRPKTGFGVPLREWLHGRLRPLVDDVLSPASIGRRGIFDVAAIRTLVAQDRDGKVDGTYTVFAVLCMELWCRQYIDGHYAVAVS